jgi:hypothetical protein
MALGQIELAARVAAGLFVIVAPTVLFLTLWRGLQAMQDDALVERVRQRTAAGSPQVAAGSPSKPVTCPNCGAGNRTGVAYCRQCLSAL